MKETIIFVHTPKSCKECRYYDLKNKCCKSKVCRYDSKRGGGHG